MSRKKKNNDDKSGTDIGMVMTCSLFLIILTFFILLNSIAVVDDRKVRAAIGSLVGSFGSLKGGLSPLKTGDSIMPPSTPLVKEKMDFNKLLLINDIKMPAKIRVVKSGESGVVTINERAIFKENSHRLKYLRISLLDQLCRFIKGGDFCVDISGHTDNRAAEEKGYRSEWEVSSLMAIQILRYMVEIGGVDPERIHAFGRGSQDPVTANDTPQSRQQNRRIEVMIHHRPPAYFKKLFIDRQNRHFTYKRFDFKID